jgi:acyl phosphate:glycerol-3-phosphate acyltransferase
MNPALAVLAVVVGYLLGAISFARLIARRLSPDKELSAIAVPVPETQEHFVFRSISATTIRMQYGAKYGCLTSVLDMLKALVPTALFRLASPDTPYYWLTAAAAVVGHNWPVYYRFQGGRGQSPLIGGLIIIDPLGLMVTNLIGLAIGQFVIKRALAAGSMWIILLIPWMMWRGEPAGIAYALIVNVAYWIAMLPEMREYWRLQRQGDLTDIQRETEMWDMGRGMGRIGRLLSGHRKPIGRSDNSSR